MLRFLRSFRKTCYLSSCCRCQCCRFFCYYSGYLLLSLLLLLLSLYCLFPFFFCCSFCRCCRSSYSSCYICCSSRFARYYCGRAALLVVPGASGLVCVAHLTQGSRGRRRANISVSPVIPEKKNCTKYNLPEHPFSPPTPVLSPALPTLPRLLYSILIFAFTRKL